MKGMAIGLGVEGPVFVYKGIKVIIHNFIRFISHPMYKESNHYTETGSLAKVKGIDNYTL